MKVVIAAVGRMKASPERTLMESYLKRLPWSVDVKEIDLKKAKSRASDVGQESERLKAVIPDHAKVVCLDARGKSLTSEQLAEKISNWRDDGTSHIAFVIGGPDGLPDDILEQADLTLSFGAVTWPHMLMRVMLAEQLYRAHSILSGHPYHCGH